MQVDDLAQRLGEPAERDLVVSAPLREFLQAAVGEVHEYSASPSVTARSTQPTRPGGPARPRGPWPSRQRAPRRAGGRRDPDRKSTPLNSSHQIISYAVFCLKKKKKR